MVNSEFLSKSQNSRSLSLGAGRCWGEEEGFVYICATDSFLPGHMGHRKSLLLTCKPFVRPALWIGLLLFKSDAD